MIERKWLRPNESDIGIEPDRDIAAGFDGDAIYAQASAQPDGAAGFYNRNVRVATGSAAAVNVRIPIPGADMMDQRQWPEPAILTAIAPFVTAAPRLYRESTQPLYQIHEFIEGQPLDRLAPRGQAVPVHVPTDVARLFSQLRAIPRSALPPTPGGLDDDPQRFARQLWDATRRAYLECRESFDRLYRQLRVPDDPFAPLDGAWKGLEPRSFRLIHCDLHRKNMIIRGHETVFLDWELALYGDPVCDVAIHLHKMSYLPDEQQRFITAWIAAEPEAAEGDWENDLRIYLVHEQIKSAVLDAVRYAKVIADGSRTPENEQILVTSLTKRLQDTAPLWNLDTPLDAPQIEAALRHESCWQR
ncbi:phosphotransferase family protein [Nocardia nepalensis]|uniref:phosphotransferase family protein n=1 Tax=Nocardia nepalensis TaxID=3375448 RepID=UPI003B683B30